jgi:hypothetical protein
VFFRYGDVKQRQVGCGSMNWALFIMRFFRVWHIGLFGKSNDGPKSLE